MSVRHTVGATQWVALLTNNTNPNADVILERTDRENKLHRTYVPYALIRKLVADRVRRERIIAIEALTDDEVLV